MTFYARCSVFVFHSCRVKRKGGPCYSLGALLQTFACHLCVIRVSQCNFNYKYGTFDHPFSCDIFEIKYIIT